jgi:NADH-quinone oxidoreductase subunit E
MSFMVKVDSGELNKIIESYPREQRYSLAILQDIQRRFGYLPREGFEALSFYLGIKIASLYSMATFYKALSLKPKGEHIVTVCDGTACHIRGAPLLLDALRRLLGVEPGDTTPDGLFTVQTVNCLGACAIAPAMVVDGQYYPKVTPDKVEEILQSCKEASHG